MKIKVSDFGVTDVLEQLGRIPITAITMIGIYFLELSKIAEFLSMISILIWMILPTLKFFEIKK